MFFVSVSILAIEKLLEVFVVVIEDLTVGGLVCLAAIASHFGRDRRECRANARKLFHAVKVAKTTIYTDAIVIGVAVQEASVAWYIVEGQSTDGHLA